MPHMSVHVVARLFGKLSSQRLESRQHKRREFRLLDYTRDAGAVQFKANCVNFLARIQLPVKMDRNLVSDTNSPTMNSCNSHWLLFRNVFGTDGMMFLLLRMNGLEYSITAHTVRGLYNAACGFSFGSSTRSHARTQLSKHTEA